MKDIILKRSLIGQFELGVFANRDFKSGETVLKYDLMNLTQKEYDNLPDSEKMFTHVQNGIIKLYLPPGRYVNHSERPNTKQDFVRSCDVAIRNIKAGEEITTDSSKEDF